MNAGNVKAHVTVGYVQLDMAVSGKVDGISFYGASLVFENKIAVRFYFNVTCDASAYTFTNKNVTFESFENELLFREVFGLL